MAAEAAERHLELLREEREAELAESRYRRAALPPQSLLWPVAPLTRRPRRGPLSPMGDAAGLTPVGPAVTYRKP